MEYQIKRCSAPCVNHVSEEEYANYVDHAIQFLKGKTDQVQKHFITLMEQESQKLNYEKAAHYRDRIQALNHIQLQQEQHDKSLDDSDIITLATANDKSCINVVFYRGRQDFGNQFFYPKHTHDRSPSDILSAFIIQFYQNHTPPRHVYLSEPIEDMELVQDTLSDLASKRVSIAVPQKGNKRTLISKVLVNAHMALQQKLSSEMQHHTFLKALVPLFDLAETPKRIEVYDNSHISGKHEVGAMIVVDDEGFNKKAYRKFSIKDIQNNHGDDYAMMREVLTRRLKNLQKEAPQYQPHIWPDLLLIDGGVGQLSAVQEVLHTLKLEIPVVAIAKGPDRNAGREVFYFAHKSPLSLPPEDPVLYFLQRIRDEAHRFVIGAHRQKRKKALTQSALDDVPNIGTKRKKALLQFFGSVQEIKNASVEELSRVEGINASLAEDIYHYFR
jgi:excinuclease ABC subunit C